MVLQRILYPSDPGDEARDDMQALIAPALRCAFPLPGDDADGRFQELLDALSRRAPAGPDRHA